MATARWTFPVQLSKGKKVQRVVYLSDRALEISRRLVLKRPTGPLLLNTDGNKADAARLLGMSRATIYRKVREYGISMASGATASWQ